jgi:phosphate:Na+ symporter
MSDPSAIPSLHPGAIITGLGGGLALFLYGMRKMTESLKTVAGGRMKSILEKLTANRFSAVLAGTLITAIIQSSSITTVLLVGFISAGLMTVAQSLGVIIGANIGTTITAQIIAFKITKYALPMIAVGFITELVGRNKKTRHYGRMIMGLGLLFFGMELMSEATNPLRSYQPFIDLMREMENPLMGILIGAVFTAIIQSSSATTGIVIVLGSQGFISLETGIGLVFGANIGTCITAMLSAIGRPREALQTATAHVIFKVLGVLLWLAFIPELAHIVRMISPSVPHLEGTARIAAETPRQIANAHTIFNVANALIFIWFTGPIAKLVHIIVPIKTVEVAPRIRAEYLDDFYLEQPEMAFDRTKLELCRMGSLVLRMQRAVLLAITSGGKKELSNLESLDEDVDTLHDEIITYLGRLSLADLVKPQPQIISGHIAIANQLESIGDVVETNLVAQGNKRLLHDIQVDPSVVNLLRPPHETLCHTLERALDAFKTDNVEEARNVVAEKADYKASLERVRNDLMKSLVLNGTHQLELFNLTNEMTLCFERIHTLCRRIGTTVIETEEAETASDVWL